MKHLLLAFLSVSLFNINVYSQASVIKDDVFNGAAKLFNKGLSKKLLNEAITTNFSDCDKAKVLPVDFGKDSLKKFLCEQTFEKDKGYLLQPGFYKASIKSFCLKAGTYAPSKGDGYLYAALKGPKEEVVYKLINNWKDHPDIEQHNLQLLLWAIIAKTKFKDLSPSLKIIAARLLSDDDVSQLSNIGIDFLSAEAMKKALANLPEPARRIAETENAMRQKFYTASVNYEEMESLAMLAGMPVANTGTPRGLWTQLPNGCYVRYLPFAYYKTYIEIYVPLFLGGQVIYFNGPGQVATPANTGAQRLAQSNIIICDNDGPGM